MKTRPVEENHPTVERQVEQDREAMEGLLTDEGGAVLAEPLVLTVRRMYKEDGDLVTSPDEEVEEIQVQDFHVEPARTSLRVNHTVNLGNFWSLSVQVGVDVPHYREEHEAAWKFAVKTAAERLLDQIELGKARAEELQKRRGPGTDLF